jgi:uncharacterized membrane protein
MLGIDYIWLEVLAKNLYQQEIGSLLVEGLTKNSQIFGASIVYLLMSSAIFFLSLQKSTKLSCQLASSVFLGLVIYGVYEGTNLALIKGWSLKVFWIDILWGMILFSLTTFITHFIHRKIKWI